MRQVMRALPVLMALAVPTALLAADQIVKLYSEGKLVTCDPAARVRDGVTYAPLRAAVGAVGAHVDWNAESQTAVVCTETQCVPIRKRQGIIVNGSLLIPVRLLGEALGREVKWDAAARAVRVGPSRGTGLL